MSPRRNEGSPIRVINEWSSKKISISRRRFLAEAALTAGTFYLALNINNQPSVQTDSEPSQSSNAQPIILPSERQTIVTMEEAMRNIGMDYGTFFKFPQGSDTLWPKLNAFKDNKLFPIYPPAVLKYKQVIYDVARETNIPPNVAAVLTSIESAGYKEAYSSAGAIGLTQPLDDKFPRALQFSAWDTKDEHERKLKNKEDPYINFRAGLGYFKICVDAVRNAFENKGLSDAQLYARAAIAYNSGAGNAATKFENLWPESQFYGDHFIRYVMTAELAKYLREKGASNRDIVKQLSSKEIDARAYALSEYRDREVAKGTFTYNNQTQALVELSKINLSTAGSTNLAAELKKDYDFFKNSSNQIYSTPASAGVRIWIALGGYSLLIQELDNLNANQWYNVTTQ